MFCHAAPPLLALALSSRCGPSVTMNMRYSMDDGDSYQGETLLEDLKSFLTTQRAHQATLCALPIRSTRYKILSRSRYVNRRRLQSRRLRQPTFCSRCAADSVPTHRPSRARFKRPLVSGGVASTDGARIHDDRARRVGRLLRVRPYFG